MCKNNNLQFYRGLCASTSHLTLHQKANKHISNNEICLFALSMPFKCVQHQCDMFKKQSLSSDEVFPSVKIISLISIT